MEEGRVWRINFHLAVLRPVDENRISGLSLLKLLSANGQDSTIISRISM